MDGSLRCLRHAAHTLPPGAVATESLGTLHNGAVALLGHGQLLLVGDVKRPVPSVLKCEAHEMPLSLLRCAASPPGWTRLVQSGAIGAPGARVASALPDRGCESERNFKSTGPEDARVLPLSGARGPAALILSSDFGRALPRAAGGGDASGAPSPPPAPYDRIGHVSLLSLEPTEPEPSARRVAQVGPARRLHFPASGAASTPGLGHIEKNWSPWQVGGSVYVHQWLDHHGNAVVHRLDPNGALTETHVSPSRGLRVALGAGGGGGGGGGSGGGASAEAADVVDVSGGTAAVRLNESHMLAVGHTRATASASKGGRRPWYASFAYVFSSSPPFRLCGATPPFLLPLPTDQRRAGALTPPPPAGHPRGELPRIQFPTGLALVGGGGRREPRVLLSWGASERETLLSHMRLPTLLQGMHAF